MQKTNDTPFANEAPLPEPAQAPAVTRVMPGRISGVGQWTFDHKASFGKESPVAWYGVRNVVANMTGIAALMGVIVGVRKGMGHGAQWAEQAGHKFLSNELSRVYTQNALGVGASFATFRTVYKMFQRSYDDVFLRPKSAEESSAAISNLPNKLWQDFKQVGAVEYPVTMIGGFVLVGIRSGIAGALPKETLAKTKFMDVLKDKHTQRDMLGCGFLAYPAFFEIIERLGGSWQRDRGFNEATNNEHRNKDKQGMERTFLRQIPGVAAGILPYIALNSWALQNGKRQLCYNAVQREAGIKAIDGLGKAYKQELPYQYFWSFSLVRDLYFDAYDKLTGKATKPGEHSAFSGVHAQETVAHGVPTSKVQDVKRQGKTTEQVSVLAV